jgi:hypothetical protein
LHEDLSFLRVGEASHVDENREVTQIFGLSQRTLRSWEEAGLIKSQRTESGYRLYDEPTFGASVRRSFSADGIFR